MALGQRLPETRLSRELQEFCRKLPKVELHAHLNGSIRDATIRELVSAQQNLEYSRAAPGSGATPEAPAPVGKLRSRGDRTLSECFALFSTIHAITTTHAVVSRITREVVEDCVADGVVYLELRTTPKARPKHDMTKQSYVEAVLQGLQAYQQQHPDSLVLVKLLLSIDRREDAAAATETVELAASLQRRGVVGVDLSGDPTLGTWSTWEPALQRARSLGLRITLHAAEVPNFAETRAMFDFGPDRLGHMCCLDGVLQARLWESRIPVELCLTSNVRTCSVPGYVDHHFARFHAEGHPVVLCTDDSGVFETSLSEEYAIAAAAFGLSQDDLTDLAERGVEHAFAEEEEKAVLRRRLAAFRSERVEQGARVARQLEQEHGQASGQQADRAEDSRTARV